MKRDIDFLRQLLQQWETSSEWILIPISLLDEAPPEDREKLHYHIELARDAGWLGAVGGDDRALRLTWNAHEFLDASRPPDRWDEVRKKLSGVPVAVLNTVLQSLAKAAADALVRGHLP